MYKFTLPELVHEALAVAATRRAAIEQVHGSETFSAALTAVLALGNYLNAGTTNGDAVAFKLAALTKLPDTKSLDGDRSLLSFLAETLLDAGLPPVGEQVAAALRSSMDISMDVRARASNPGRMAGVGSAGQRMGRRGARQRGRVRLLEPESRPDRPCAGQGQQQVRPLRVAVKRFFSALPRILAVWAVARRVCCWMAMDAQRSDGCAWGSRTACTPMRLYHCGVPA